MATMRWRADPDQLALIREFVAQASCELGADERAIFDLQLAVDEICSNVINHGYGGRGGEIEITVERAGASIRLVVRDWGGAFEPDQVPVPDLMLPLERRKLGGLGLFIVRKVMDEVEFGFNAQQGNTVTMVKQLDRQEQTK